jgi:hypothetical protein
MEFRASHGAVWRGAEGQSSYEPLDLAQVKSADHRLETRVGFGASLFAPQTFHGGGAGRSKFAVDPPTLRARATNRT